MKEILTLGNRTETTNVEKAWVHKHYIEVQFIASSHTLTQIINVSSVSYQLHFTKCTSANDFNEWKVIHFHAKLTNGCSYTIIWNNTYKVLLCNISTICNLILQTGAKLHKTETALGNWISFQQNRLHRYSNLTKWKWNVMHSMPAILSVNQNCEHLPYTQIVTNTATPKSYTSQAWKLEYGTIMAYKVDNVSLTINLSFLLQSVEMTEIP